MLMTWPYLLTDFLGGGSTGVSSRTDSSVRALVVLLVVLAVAGGSSGARSVTTTTGSGLDICLTLALPRPPFLLVLEKQRIIKPVTL